MNEKGYQRKERVGILLFLFLGVLFLLGGKAAHGEEKLSTEQVEQLDQAEQAEQAEQADQVLDPKEAEDPDLILFSLSPKPEFGTPERVVEFVHQELGLEWEWTPKVPNVVVIRNAGSGYEPSSQEAAYDDLILIVTPSRVLHFAYGNAEGTEHRSYVRRYGYDKYVDQSIGKAMTPALDSGRYRFKVALHAGKYKALHLYSWDWERFGLPSQRRNGKYGKYEVGAVNLHKGGSVWNWSVGCLTIHYARYSQFIEQFEMGAWGRLYLVGEWDGSYPKKVSAD